MHLPDGAVSVLGPDGEPALADVTRTQYETRAVPSGPAEQEPYVDSGVSVRALLAAAEPGLDLSRSGFTEISRPDGSWSTLQGADLSSPSDFTGGLLPVVHFDGSQVEYDRPLRGEQDTNATDILRTAGALDLYVHTGSLLTVTSAASRTTVPRGTAVTFTATAAGATGFSWDFGDGTPVGTGATVSHAFPTSGTVLVGVTATGPDDSAGAAAPLAVTVGTPAAVSPPPVPTRPAARAPGPATSRSAAAPAAARRAPASAAPGAAAPAPAAPSVPPVPPSPPPVRGLPVVTGQLVGAGAVLRSADLASDLSSPRAAVPVPVPRGGAWRRWATGIAGGCLLLAFGAVRERRGTSRERRHR